MFAQKALRMISAYIWRVPAKNISQTMTIFTRRIPDGRGRIAIRERTRDGRYFDFKPSSGIGIDRRFMQEMGIHSLQDDKHNIEYDLLEETFTLQFRRTDAEPVIVPTRFVSLRRFIATYELPHFTWLPYYIPRWIDIVVWRFRDWEEDELACLVAASVYVWEEEMERRPFTLCPTWRHLMTITLHAEKHANFKERILACAESMCPDNYLDDDCITDEADQDPCVYDD
jgi:hypothetical protein